MKIIYGLDYMSGKTDNHPPHVKLSKINFYLENPLL
ncbi:unnamed protein product, partial [Rotaria sp. Silwood1]